MRLTRSDHFSEVTFACTNEAQSGKARGVRRCGLDENDLHGSEFADGGTEAADFQLPFQHFAARLDEQQILRVVAREHIVEQSAR